MLISKFCLYNKHKGKNTQCKPNIDNLTQV